MLVSSELPMTFRFSRPSDARDVTDLRRLAAMVQCVPPLAVFPWRSEAEFTSLIERSVLCITAVSTITGKPAGFLCLDDKPHTPSLSPDEWENMLTSEMGNDERGESPIAPYNTLWIKSLICPHPGALQAGNYEYKGKTSTDIKRNLLIFSYTEEMLLRELLHVALSNTPQTVHLLVPFPEGQPYGPLEKVSSGLISVHGCPFLGSVLHIRSSRMVPQLLLRLGIVEDYDNYVVRILGGDGLITSVPEEFYLEELLKDQDKNNKVVVAEDVDTHKVVGIMCLEASIEDQQVISRQYSTELYGKLRPLRKQRLTTGVAQTPNIVKIKFFYIEPAYDLSAGQFLPFVFKEFPFAEYIVIVLPYSTEKPPFLSHFEHVPLRKYQPRNSKGDLVVPPDGLWIRCRYTADPVSAIVVRSDREVSDVSAFLTEQLVELGEHHKTALLEDVALSQRARGNSPESEEVHCTTMVFSFSSTTLEGVSEEESNKSVIGVASVRLLTVHDMYNLRANYDLDMFINYYTGAPRDYSETNVMLSPEDGRQVFFRDDVRGLLIRCFYVKPVYRSRIPFFLREILRHSRCEVAMLLGDKIITPFAPMLTFMLRIPPRRVLEKRQGTCSERAGSESPEKDQLTGKDVLALSCLFSATRRFLGDCKKLVHTRIIVVGAGSTGLTFIHRLLSVPYLCFTNLVLISNDGMPAHPNQQPRLWSVERMELLEREHMLLSVGNPVRVVHGSVVDIDTNHRYVAVDDGTYEPYDYVILTPGWQFGVPLAISRLQLGQQQQQQQSRGAVPPGILPLSGSSSVEKLMQFLHEFEANPQNISNIIVYGSGLDAFAAATSIVDLGFSPQRIVIVSPETTNPFFDSDVFECVKCMWSQLGANTMRGYQVSRMEYGDEGNTLNTVVVSRVVKPTSEGGRDGGARTSDAVEILCSLIVCCEDKDIDSHILSTLNRRSIVFDGRVTVEANYRTTDKYVYAAGPVAMFTRRYGTTPNFDDFNARDVGENLAEVMLGTLGFSEYWVPSLELNKSRGDEILAASDELYNKVLEENGSRAANYATKMGGLSEGQDMHEIAKQNQLMQQKKLPVYQTPIASRVRLPGMYQFFCCQCVFFNPKNCRRLLYSSIDDNKPNVEDLLGFQGNGHSQTTVPERPGHEEQSLLSIYVNKHTHIIDAVVYFGNGNPELHNYKCLVGMPQSLLNLIYRYEEGQSRLGAGGESSTRGLNLMEYLRSPKLEVIFYDRFVDFYKKLRIKMKQHEDVVDMKTRALDVMQDSCMITKEQRDEYLRELTDQRGEFARKVQCELIKFLHESKEYLPQIMYLPDIRNHVNKEG
uniref:Cilia- and flagella-associated protein 61 N-terminal domain-containing protein n=1 Tax=Trypanosoma vivax (strain Y486) TaxID=1055687 RepID=G0TXS8_TRYVY|nr:conserved hypothetical protein [Trypanosoma vivax Y486]